MYMYMYAVVCPVENVEERKTRSVARSCQPLLSSLCDISCYNS